MYLREEFLNNITSLSNINGFTFFSLLLLKSKERELFDIMGEKNYK